MHTEGKTINILIRFAAILNTDSLRLTPYYTIIIQWRHFFAHAGSMNEDDHDHLMGNPFQIYLHP